VPLACLALRINEPLSLVCAGQSGARLSAEERMANAAGVKSSLPAPSYVTRVLIMTHLRGASFARHCACRLQALRV